MPNDIADRFPILGTCDIVDADVDGNIGYQLSGYIPIRAAGHTGATPVMGDGSHDWQGYVPFDHTPHTLNPARGYIATANEKVTSDNYPYLIQVDRDFAPAYRGMRIRQLIEGFGRPIVPSDMRTIHGDWKRYVLNNISLLFLFGE
jgi:penicillin amidase